MKRKLALLILPAALCIATMAMKWRVDHPLPTSEDLAVRALLTQSNRSLILIGNGISNIMLEKSLPPQELEECIESLYVYSPPIQAQKFDTGIKTIIGVEFYFAQPREDNITSVFTSLDSNRPNELYVTYRKQGLRHTVGTRTYALSALTVKRWSKILRDFTHAK
ncbi:hypothetical protein EON80_18045 [bacterium]|nr:MAG: hypothetical protein EON80_18045 [bacterium]